jgi:hypothetical protein
MRATETFVLRLLVDNGEPGRLCGVLRSVASGEEHAFTDGQALLALLHVLIAKRPGTPTQDNRVNAQNETKT